MTRETATPEEIRRAQRVAEMRAKTGGPRGWVHPVTPPTTPQPLEFAPRAPMRLLTEQHMREIIGQYKMMEKVRDPHYNRDQTIEDLSRIALHEQSIVRSFGKRIAMQKDYIRWASPNGYEVHRDNMRTCPKLADAEKPGYNCRDCRREDWNLFRMCHQYPLWTSAPETRKFLKR